MKVFAILVIGIVIGVYAARILPSMYAHAVVCNGIGSCDKGSK